VIYCDTQGVANQMERYRKIDMLMAEGHNHIKAKDTVKGCDKWLEAWGEIKALLSEGVAHDVFALDKKHDFADFISNFVQDLEIELHNAGLADREYHKKRAIYCEELLPWCVSNESIVENTRRGMADGYFEYGETAKAEELYKGWLDEDPDWGYGYIGWSDNYCFGPKEKQYEKAEEILLTGYGREGLRDKGDLVDRLVDLYEDMGKPDKAKEYKAVSTKLHRAEAQKHKPTPVKVVKVGRNEPCPCGSGKKYKKCCLS